MVDMAEDSAIATPCNYVKTHVELVQVKSI